MINAIVLLGAIVLAAGGNVFLKLGARNFSMVELFQNYYLFLGIFCFVLSLILYFYILSKINLSIAYPILTSGSIILVTVVSYCFFNESINLKQVIGLFFLLIAILLISQK